MPDFSLPSETHLGYLCLAVGDLAGSLSFYSSVLGLRELERQGGNLSLGTDDGRPLLLLKDEPGARPRPRRSTGLYHFALLLPSRRDLARTLRHLDESRYPLMGAADHRVSEALYLSDPEGNGIEIYADRPRYLWTAENGELEMTTDPLDVESLMAELQPGDENWSRLSSSTLLGHIHLQVADLDKAEAFYHGVLGFDPMQRYGPSALFLSAGGYHHHIGLNTWAGLGAPTPPPDAAGLRYFTMVLPSAADLEQARQRLQAAGLDFEEMGEGILVHDPSHNGVLLTTG